MLLCLQRIKRAISFCSVISTKVYVLLLSGITKFKVNKNVVKITIALLLLSGTIKRSLKLAN